MSVITISRDIKSGGREIANCLAEKLNYTCLINRDVIAECARKYNIVEENLLNRLEEAPNIWQRLTREHHRYLIYVQSAILEAVKKDNVVYHGLAGQLFLSGIQHVFKLKIVAPFESRVDLAMQEMNIDREEAIKFLNNADDKRNRWFRIIYGEDRHRLSLYDLSVNRQNVSNETLCNIVALAVNSEDFKTNEHSMAKLKNLSTACEVKAAFATDDRLWDQDIKVSASGSVVTLMGIVKNEKIRDELIDIATKVKGVTKCETRLSLRSSGISDTALWND